MACETVQEIIDTLATAEAFAVTLLGEALASAANGKLALDAEQQQSFQAARAADQAHYVFLKGAGAKPSTTTFNLPDPSIVTNAATFLKAMIELEELVVAAYLAAAQAFAILKETKWVQHSLAIGAVAAEHRVLTRVFAIDAGILEGPPNDVAWEKAKFASVGAAAAELEKLGFMGGSGGSIAYPGPGAISNAGVKYLRP